MKVTFMDITIWAYFLTDTLNWQVVWGKEKYFFLYFHIYQFIKRKLMQILKSPNIFAFIWKWYVEDFTLKHLLPFKICTHEICEKYLYKHFRNNRIC